MKTRNLFIKYYLMAALVLFTGTGLRAQVTIGDDKAPESFSALEIISSNGTRGLRLPHLTTAERDALQLTFPASTADPNLSKGLMIYNTDLDCVQTWNGEDWISLCTGEEPVTPEIPGSHAAPTLGQNGWATVNLSTGGPGGEGPMKVTVPAGSTVRWYDSNNQRIAAADGLLSWDPELVLSTLLQPGVNTFYAKSAIGNAVSEPITVTFTICGMYSSETTFHRFMCHDLGAEQSSDPFEPHPNLIGNPYKWGLHTPVRTVAEARADYLVTSYNFPNWSTQGGTLAPSTAVWSMTSDNMPCPPTYRVPEFQVWESIKTEIERLSSNIVGTVTTISGIEYRVNYLGRSLPLPKTPVYSWTGNWSTIGDDSARWSTSTEDDGWAYLGKTIRVRSSGDILLESWMPGSALAVRCVAQ